ncbi:MAG: hypothetical protein ACTSR0_02525 [Candidatus Asgardarchaeia archaeon]
MGSWEKDEYLRGLEDGLLLALSLILENDKEKAMNEMRWALASVRERRTCILRRNLEV